jgi:hypothetical protein
MKIKSFMAMMVAAVTIVLGMSSCSSDDEPEVAVATQVAGSYTGNEIVMVMGEESSNDTKTYSFTKVSDTTIDMAIPEMGMGGMMTIPPLTVKNIPLTKSDGAIMGKLDSFAGTVLNASGSERAFTISNITVALNGNTVVVTFSLKFGSMPMSMETTFTGTKK